MIKRDAVEADVRRALRRFPVILITGPRQCGKTTLARRLERAEGGTYFDLEDPEVPLRPETAMLVLKDLRGLVVLDEFQRQPKLFEVLRVLADRRPLPARFLVLGSASPDLVRGVSETLAGRAAYLEMGGFDLREIGATPLNRLWVRGGFPDSFLAPGDASSLEWRKHFVRSLLERDIPQLGIRVPAATLRRFWIMLAHYHGQIWNSADFARSLGSQESTARRYLDILTGSFLVRQLPPWFANIGKRVVRSPKVYLRDTGLLHALLGLGDLRAVRSHPTMGFSWEGFALEQVVRLTRAENDAHFFATHAGAELDLLLQRRGRRFGFEFKYADSPRTTKSIRVVMADLRLDRLWVVYPGSRRYPLDAKITALPLADLAEVVEEELLER